MKISYIDNLIINLTDILVYFDTNTNDKLRDLIDILINKKLEILESEEKK